MIHLYRECLRTSREPVEKSRSLLKLSRELLGTSQNRYIVDDGAPAQIEEIFASITIARPSSLPPTNMGQGMLNCHSFTQVSTPLWRRLPLSSLGAQGFVGLKTHTAPVRARRAWHFQGRLSRRFLWEKAQPHRGQRALPVLLDSACSAGPKSRVHVCFAKCFPSRTGQALQGISRSSLRSRTTWLLT